MDNIIYVAINKKTGKVMSGAKGQYAFGEQGSLARSIGQGWRWLAQKEGIKPKDMYNVIEVNIAVDATEEGMRYACEVN